MIRAAIISLGLLALSSCTIVQGVADGLAREQARGVVNGIVAERFPGAQVTPITDCVINNASAQELVGVGSAAATGVTQQTINTVTAILQRPETLRCVTQTATLADLL